MKRHHRAGAVAASALALVVARAAAAQEPAGDDRYQFAAQASEARPVSLERTPDGLRLAWSRPASDWDTALLGLRVDAGAEADPWIELGVAGTRVEQHLEASARGWRWLNLSGLRERLSAGADVAIEAHGVALEPEGAELRLFANHLDLERRILILAPHPDDAEMAAFGLYAGSNATIVTVTSGNAGDANYRDDFPDRAEQYLFKGYLRAVDSVTVPWQGGIPPERCFNLGYFDARLALMHSRPQEAVPEMYGPNQDVAAYRRANLGRLLPTGSRTNSWAHLVEDVGAVLARVKPEIVVMPHPMLDIHPDHEFVAVAAVEALARWNRPIIFLLYTNHAYEDFYPFGPAGSAVSLPPWRGAALPVEGVYSHPVTPELQRRKLYALESMHDLRLSPTEQAGCLPPGTPAKRPDYPRQPAVDYFRRGPRSNELFFVFGRDGVRQLVASFLAQFRLDE